MTAMWTPLMRRLSLAPRAWTVGVVVAAWTILGCTYGRAEEASTSPSDENIIWACNYIAATPRGPLQITTKFQVFGDELAEIETIPERFNFGERYKILENTETYIVAAISLGKFVDNPSQGIGAVIVIIAKQNGLFQQTGAILGLRVGPPTLGHCEMQ